MEALGKTYSRSKDAQIAEAEAHETKIKTADAARYGEEARLQAETQIAEAAKEKN